VYINPKLTKVSRAKSEKHEGCLSIRGKWGTVPRSEKATIQAYDERGRKFMRGASGFLAHVFQHEMDHLNGKLFIDDFKPLRRKMALENVEHFFGSDDSHDDFFFYKGRPSIFFAVEIGALASFVVLYLIFRKHQEKAKLLAVEKVKSWVPTIICCSTLFSG